jgi:hypothetical protein
MKGVVDVTRPSCDQDPGRPVVDFAKKMADFRLPGEEAQSSITSQDV